MAQSESWPQPNWDAVEWTRAQFTQDIPRILLNWINFVKRNGPIFLLTIVQVWSATTENIWLRLLLPKEGQPVIKSKGSHNFSSHCNSGLMMNTTSTQIKWLMGSTFAPSYANILFGAPEWRSSLRHCISMLEASLQTLVRSRAVSQPAMI